MRKYLLSAAVLSAMVLAASGNGASAANLSVVDTEGASGNVTATGDCGFNCNDWSGGATGVTAGSETWSGNSVIANPSGNHSVVSDVDLIDAPDGQLDGILDLSWGGGSTETLGISFCGISALGGCSQTGTFVNTYTEDATGSASFGDPVDGHMSIEVSTPVPAPEPASLSLLGAGLAGLGLIRRRRRQTR
jgi:hypothetical protein